MPLCAPGPTPKLHQIYFGLGLLCDVGLVNRCLVLRCLKREGLFWYVIVNRSLVWTYQVLYWKKDLINLLIDMVIRLFRPTACCTTIMFS